MRRDDQPIENDQDITGFTFHFQISNGGVRQACSVKVQAPSMQDATAFFRQNWPTIETMAREGLAGGSDEGGRIRLVMPWRRPPLNLRRFGRSDRDVPRGAYDARRAVGIGVASDCLEEKEKLLGKHGGSPVTKMSSAIIASYAVWLWGLVIRITFRVPYFDSVKKARPPGFGRGASASVANQLPVRGPTHAPSCLAAAAYVEDDVYKLIESESDQARAKQDKTCNGHSEEAFRSEFIPHGTPPITCPGSQRTTAPLHSQRVSCRIPDFAAPWYFRATPRS
jgi:hypothetical protein